MKNYRMRSTHWLISTQIPIDEILILSSPVRKKVSDDASLQPARVQMVQSNFRSYPLDHKGVTKEKLIPYEYKMLELVLAALRDTLKSGGTLKRPAELANEARMPAAWKKPPKKKKEKAPKKAKPKKVVNKMSPKTRPAQRKAAKKAEKALDDARAEERAQDELIAEDRARHNDWSGESDSADVKARLLEYLKQYGLQGEDLKELDNIQVRYEPRQGSSSGDWYYRVDGQDGYYVEEKYTKFRSRPDVARFFGLDVPPGGGGGGPRIPLSTYPPEKLEGLNIVPQGHDPDARYGRIPCLSACCGGCVQTTAYIKAVCGYCVGAFDMDPGKQEFARVNVGRKVVHEERLTAKSLKAHIHRLRPSCVLLECPCQWCTTGGKEGTRGPDCPTAQVSAQLLPAVAECGVPVFVFEMVKQGAENAFYKGIVEQITKLGYVVGTFKLNAAVAPGVPYGKEEVQHVCVRIGDGPIEPIVTAMRAFLATRPKALSMAVWKSMPRRWRGAPEI